MSEEEDLLDFRNFMFGSWQHLDHRDASGGYTEPTRLQYFVGEQMQRGPNRSIVLCFRGFGKSTIGTTRGVHALDLDCERKFLNTSAAKGKADEATQFMLNLIDSYPPVRHLYPTSSQRAASIQFDVAGCAPAHAPSVRSLGILSNQVTGSRATDILADDIESKENSATLNMRQRIREKARELGGAVLRSGQEVVDPKICFLGTPQIEESLYWALEKESGYKIIIIPARYPTEEQEAMDEGRHGLRLAQPLKDDLKANPSLRGQPTEPTRFGEKELAFRLAEYGPSGWALQFLLLPHLSREDLYPLKINDLLVMDLDSEVGPEKVIWAHTGNYRREGLPCVGFSRDWWHSPADLIGKHVPYQSNCMAVDVSTGGRDELAYVVLKALNSQIFLLEVGGYKQGSDERTMVKLAHTAKKFGITHVHVEKNFGLGMWSQLFRPHLSAVNPGCEIEDVHTSGRKEVRMAEILEPVIAGHRLVVNATAVQTDYDSTQSYSDSSLGRQLFYQMSRLTRERGCLEYDDRLDALALGVSYFQDHMARDFQHEMLERQEGELDDMLEQWADLSLFTGNPKASRQSAWARARR